MGVPTFYRWLCCRYPKVVVDVINPQHLHAPQDDEQQQQQQQQQQQDGSSGDQQQQDGSSGDQQQQTEYDCLYLDMNGIIHPCCHSDDGVCPATEDDMFLRIFSYIDFVVNIIKPKLLLYLAIDGVAPRAKMNQQRIRRFKAAKDIEEETAAYEDIKRQFIKEGRAVPAPKVRWDSNVITPGTPFMDRLAKALRFYIMERVNNNKLFKNIQIYLSDANVPGEGEHKIVEFIREQRKSK
ncbi:exoribonuclease, putative, partial [Eimeria acervulina]